MLYDFSMIEWPIWISGALFAVIHSLFASTWCKQRFYQLGMRPQRYRLLYSIFATILTGLWILYIYQLADAPLYEIDGWSRWLMISVQLIGASIALISLRSFDTKLFLGIADAPDDREPFHEHGLYRYVRHPMYTGVMLVLFANPSQSINSFNLALIISCYFIAGSWLEERRMQHLHPHYADYCSRVSAFIPWRTLLSRLRRS